MAECIEREALMDAVLELPPKMDEDGYGWLARRGVWQMIADFPAADVVEVVRCKDCKHRGRLSGWCRGIHQEITDDEAETFYCAYGERREDD